MLVQCSLPPLPARARQMCTDGAACKRRVCFFAHYEHELRRPEADPVLLSLQLQQELGGAWRAGGRPCLGGCLGAPGHILLWPAAAGLFGSAAYGAKE